MVSVAQRLRDRDSGDKVIIVNIWEGMGKITQSDSSVIPKFLRFVKKLELDRTKGLEFTYKEFDYVMDPEYVDKFDSQNRPMMDFLIEHSKPIHLRVQKVPKDDDSSAFHKVYTKRQLSSILASATRLVAQTSPYIYILAGYGLGAIITLIMAHFGIFGNIFTPTTTVTGGGVTSGGGR